MAPPFHRRIVVGVEVETYSIETSTFRIGRRLVPKAGLSERGEKFSRDASIGSEYNSRPFHTVREALFLLKSGIRKYLGRLYRTTEADPEHLVPLLVGGWTDRFAGAHLHFSTAGEELSKEDCRTLAYHLHGHVPLMIAIGANSPVWRSRLTARDSNRIVRGSAAYFKPIRRGTISSVDLREMLYNKGRKSKPPTLELRVLDSNIPEYLVASLAVAKAAALRWWRDRGAANKIDHAGYLAAREAAAARGMRARLSWRGRALPAPEVLDRFFREHAEEIDAMDMPEELYDVFRLLKRGYNGARIVREAARAAIDEHPQTWQRRFAKRYAHALELLLSGNSLRDFAHALKVRLPAATRTEVG